MLYPEKTSYIQVERPVLGGAEDFLAQARHIGGRVLGDTVRTSVTETGLSMDGQLDGNPELLSYVVPVHEPVLKMASADHLKVVLLHRRAAKPVASRYAFPHHHNSFATPMRSVYSSPEGGDESSPRVRKQSLYRQLDAVSLDHDVDPAALPVLFDTIEVVSRDERGVVFGLLPRLGSIGLRVLAEQARVCELRVRQQAPKLADLPGVTDGMGIRFASAPRSVSDIQIDQLVDSFKELTPVRVELGPPEARSKDSRRD